MKHYYDILDANYSDSLQTIHKKYKKKARQWHPDMFKESNDKIIAEEKFKEIQHAFSQIKKNQNSTTNFFGNINSDMDFKNFTEKLINKGSILNTIINNAKNIDLKDFFNTFFVHIKKFRYLYDDLFSEEKVEDLIVNINVSLEDIYNKEDKIIELKRIRKCEKCYNNDLKFCTICSNKNYLEQTKSFIFNCSDKVIVFSNEGHQEHKKKTGDIVLKIQPKIHSQFKLINNYDVFYEIYTSKLETISHSFIYLDKQKMVFKAEFPYRKKYVFEDKGLPIPYSETLGKLIITIIYNPFTYSENSVFSIHNH
jgi:DnaJ-class molecular chaperone